MFTNDPGDQDSISGSVIPNTQKIVLHTSLINTQYYKIHFKGKVEQSRERSKVLTYISEYELLKVEPSSHLRLRSPTWIYDVLLEIRRYWYPQFKRKLNFIKYSPFLFREFSNFEAGVLQRFTLATYLFIICQDDILWMSIDLMK